jgi:UDP-2,3-diacylglucosamine hydrolase
VASLFISDLHLRPERPATTALFLAFLENTVSAADTLYILGDLFEYWAGDDDLNDPHHATIAAALAQCGATVNLLHGNRDFLLGPVFAQAAALTLLEDPRVIDLDGVPTLLSHGDTLCSDDRDYLELREKIRNPAWISAFLAQPLALRKTQIETMRQHSEQEKQSKDYALMDANPDSVAAALRDHACARLIHGHTHRPAHHHHQVDGHTCERWVLPAWDDHAGYLCCSPDGCKALRIAG